MISASLRTIRMRPNKFKETKMCKVCVDYVKGGMTPTEALKNLSEMPSDSEHDMTTINSIVDAAQTIDFDQMADNDDYFALDSDYFFGDDFEEDFQGDFSSD